MRIYIIYIEIYSYAPTLRLRQIKAENMNIVKSLQSIIQKTKLFGTCGK